MGDASYYKDDKWLVRSNPELEKLHDTGWNMDIHSTI